MEKRDIHIQNTFNTFGSLPLVKVKENKSTFFSQIPFLPIIKTPISIY
ncbi:hypothetical protein [Flavobacterium sp.]